MVNYVNINPFTLTFIIIVLFIAFCLLSFKLGSSHRKHVAEATIKSAEEEAKKIINDAVKSSESKRKEVIIEAKDEAFKIRSETDKELKERRLEVSRQERRITQKEEALEKKVENIEKREELVATKLKEINNKLDEVEAIKKQEFDLLGRISGLSKNQATEKFLFMLEEELTHEKALKISEYSQKIIEESETKARDIISQAIQRYAADEVTEITVSVVSLPNDDMKGRIIGREGRNIRTLETLLGIDLIIDDTPETITISCTDPVRREIARLTLQKLITDGRIHPGRIEETVEKAKNELEHKIKEDGEQAILNLGIHNMHPELVKLIGKLKYRTSYGQNIYLHSIEVANLAAMMAAELGLNVSVAKRAGLLHDIGKALSFEVEGSHVQIGTEIAKKYNESPAVVHIIESHHNDITPNSAVAFLVQAADAISAARPGARKENIEKFIKKIEKLEEIANSFDGVEKSYAIQAGREIRIMVNPEDINDDEMTILSYNIAKKIEQELEYPGQIRVNVIREKRAIDYAK